MPGAGKSTFGKRLARVLDYDFIDLDDAIEQYARQSIPQLFESGEDHFREQESATLKSIIDDARPMVIASGGGTPCFNDNMSLILEHGISVFLDPPLEVLIRRTEKETHRPLLQGRDLKERLRELYSQRQAFYQLANIHLTDESPDPQGVINLFGSIRN